MDVEIFECESCHLEFKQKATLLRHVSHKKVCKSHYGESRLNDMRIEGKLLAKRKWWKDHASLDAKESYQLNKTKVKERKKEKYVPEAKRRHTDEGKAFTKFYEFIYMESKERAIKDLQDSGFAYDKVEKDTKDKAINLVFTSIHDGFLSFFSRNARKIGLFAEFTDDYPVETETEKAMEQSYEENFEHQIKVEMDKWLEKVSQRISSKCQYQGENSAFSAFFKEFCETLYPEICEKSIDFAFDNIEEADDNEEEISDKKFEEMLEEKYHESLEEEAIKAAIDSDIGYKMTLSLDSKIAKQIRFMKVHEKTVTTTDLAGNVLEKIVYLRK